MTNVDAKRVLEHYAPQYQPRRIDVPPDAVGFSGASVFQVQTDAGPFALRCWPVNALPRTRMTGLHRLLGHMQQQGITQVAVPVAATDGRTLVSVLNRFWQLEPWMPGDANFQANLSAERLRATMRTLANCHRAMLSFEPQREEATWFFNSPKSPSPAVGERLELLQQWQQGKTERLQERMAAKQQSPFYETGNRIVKSFRQVAEAVFDQLQVTVAMEFRLQPCFRDIWRGHVLFTGNEVTGIIDPSACRAENVAADLSRLLGSLLGDDRTARTTALEEYAKHRMLTPAELGLIEILDCSGVLLSAMNWLDRHFLKGEQFARREAVLERLEILRQRLEALAAGV